MTRINAHIPPETLCNQHLLAEYREILRVVTLSLRKADKKGKEMLKEIPTEFKLGGGHVTFFYDKLKYIHLRFESIRKELINRNIAVSFDFDDSKLKEYQWLYNDWELDPIAKNLVIERIYERALTMKRINFPNSVKTPDEYLEILRSS